jgi:Domain of unknown function (DUF4357)
MGKQIRIYLADGGSTGIRHAEITNWSGQALACPRSRFQELREWNEVKRPGVYFLFGQDEQTGESAVYIGEAEVVVERLASHINGKDFWNELVAFTSKDDNLTKGHIRYLESRLIYETSACGRYLVKNSTQPQVPVLPRGDRDAMEEYIESVKALLGVLGHRLLEPLLEVRQLLSHVVLHPTIKQKSEPSNQDDATTVAVSGHKLYLSTKDLEATAMQTDEGLVVLKDSDAALDVMQSLPVSQRELRKKLMQQGVLVANGSNLKFAKDYLFNSPSQAAGIVVGYSINGRFAWKLSDGITTYSMNEQMLSEKLLREIGSEAIGYSQTDQRVAWQREDRER